MKIKLLLVSILALFPVSDCEGKSPSIATTVYPVQYLVERIGGSDVTVSDITENTMIQHARIRSSFRGILRDSDAPFYVDGSEPYIDLYVDDIRGTGMDMVDLVTKSAIYKFERYTSATIDGITTGTEGPYYEGEELTDLDTYDADPMLWMDSITTTNMANGIHDYLVQKYPQYKDIFGENYDTLELDLAQLEADFQTIPDNRMNISFVSMTPSFGGWQKPYGIEVYLVTLSKYGTLPTSDRLAAVKKRIKSDHVQYITIEQNLSEDMKKLQQRLIDELTLIPVDLNSLSSISGEDKKTSRDYLAIIYDNLKALESVAS